MTTKRPACYAPWTHLNTDAAGLMRPCCICKLKIKANSIEEGWNSPEMKSIRVRMLNGEIPPEYCSSCINPASTIVYSSTFDLDVAKGTKAQEVLDKTLPDGTTTFTPVSIDLRTHLCNLKCRTCSAFASSALRAEQKKFKIPTMVYNTTPLSDLSLKDMTLNGVNFIDDAIKFYWAGGEPFMSPIHWEIMQYLVDTKNTDQVIFYSTNATFPGKTLEKTIDLLKHFTKVELVVSIDGDGDYGNYVRAGSDMDEVWDNIAILKKHLPNAIFGVNTTITNAGILSLAALLKRCEDHDIKWIGHLLNRWEYNQYLSEKILTKEVFLENVDAAIKVTRNKEALASLRFIRDSYSSLDVTETDFVESARYEEIRGMKGFFAEKILPFTNRGSK